MAHDQSELRARMGVFANTEGLLLARAVHIQRAAMRVSRFTGVYCWVVPFAIGCAANKDVPKGDNDVVLGPKTEVRLALPAQAEQQKESLDRALSQVDDWSSSQLLEHAQVDFASLGYDPAEAIGLDLIKTSELGLSDSELEVLGDQGFVLSERNVFPTFTYGYQLIYGDDLPLYVSADSILNALHVSYDNILEAFEQQSLIGALSDLLEAMRARLPAAAMSDQVRADLDLYLGVAQSLLSGKAVSSSDPAVTSSIASLTAQCEAADGAEELMLLGSSRRIDFSQCEPRGHYTDSEALMRYFRTMMWLGRIDFRLIETQEDGSQVFRRQQFEDAWHLVDLMQSASLASYEGIDAVITAFVGEHDYMTAPQFDDLAKDLDISGLDELEQVDDATIAAALVAGGYGTQRISSHYMINGAGVGTLPLSSSFALFGQRYVIDSHVFSNVVYDRAGGGSVLRMMPSPLDAAYAALGNDYAATLLGDELEKYDYASDLQKMRVIADSEPSEFWEKNLYNRWLGALRTLSPSSALRADDDESLPAVAQTKSWSARLLNTQLASWAELRHDTILYAKQSYTGGVSCEFPDAYVEPYPAFFAMLEGYASEARDLIAGLPFAAPPALDDYFAQFGASVATLRQMAEHQRTGTPHSEEHMAFINQAVALESVQVGCTYEQRAVGWYPDMIYGDPLEFAPTIADVHTQPTDEAGAEVGRILHVATGEPRLMVVTVETCSGPRAYAGLASSYYELITEDWERLTDLDWEKKLDDDDVPEPPAWVQPLMSK